MKGEIRAPKGTQPWVEALDSRAREEYEQARAEEIQDWSRLVGDLLEKELGESTLDTDRQGVVAEKLATVIRDGFEQGMEMGMRIGREENMRELEHLRSFQLRSLGG